MSLNSGISESHPLLVAFDLEFVRFVLVAPMLTFSVFSASYTLWDLWIDTHVTGAWLPPLSPDMC